MRVWLWIVARCRAWWWRRQVRTRWTPADRYDWSDPTRYARTRDVINRKATP